MRNANALDSQPFHPPRKKNAAKRNGPKNGSNKNRAAIDGLTETIAGRVRMPPLTLPVPVGNEQATQPVVIVALLGLDEAARVEVTKAAAKAVAGRGVVVTVDVLEVATKVVEAGTNAVEIDETVTKDPIQIPHPAVQSRSSGLNLRSQSPRRCNKAKNRSDPSRI